MSGNRPPFKRTTRETKIKINPEHTETIESKKNGESPYQSSIEAINEMRANAPLAEGAAKYKPSSPTASQPGIKEGAPTPYGSMPLQTPHKPLPAATDYKSMPPQKNPSGEMPGFPRNANSTTVLNQLLEETPPAKRHHGRLPKNPVIYGTLPPEQAPKAEAPQKPSRAVGAPKIEFITLENKLAIFAEKLKQPHADKNISYKVFPDSLKIEMTIANKDNNKSIVKEFSLPNVEKIDKYLAKLPPQELNSLYLTVIKSQSKPDNVNVAEETRATMRPK